MSEFLFRTKSRAARDTQSEAAHRSRSNDEKNSPKNHTRYHNPNSSGLPLFLQTKLTLSQSDDAFEQEAERNASALKSVHEESVDFEQVRLSTASNTTKSQALPNATASEINSRRGKGSPLPKETRQKFEQSFQRDFSDVSVHDDAQSHRLSQSLGANAFTFGNDISFAQGRYSPDTLAGQKLLAHELTHVVQQQGAGSKTVQRDPDPNADTAVEGTLLTAQTSFTNGEITLNGGEPLVAAGPPRHGYITVKLTPPSIHADQPFTVPLSVVGGTAVTVLTGQPPNLNQMYDLGPASMFPDLQEGVVTDISLDQLPPAAMSSLLATQDDQSATNDFLPGWMFTQAGRTIGRAADSHLLTNGFRAAGPEAIGLVGYPRTTPLAALQRMNMPQSPIMFGHTIIYVRQGNTITAMTSFGPKSLLAAGLDAYSSTNNGVSAQIIQHLEPQGFPLNVSGTHGFTNTGAISIEYPVDASAAKRMAANLTGQQADDMLRYAAFMESCPSGSNCVAWALDQMEGELGGPVGQQSRGPLYHQSGQNTARQGAFQRMGADVLEHQRSGGTRGSPMMDTPNATGPAVAGQMSTGMKVVKWGGRIFFVGGLVYSGYRIGSADTDRRDMVAQEEALTQGAGLALGPMGGLVADAYGVPLVQMAHGEMDESLMILPHPFMLPVARYLEPAKHDPEGARLVRSAVLDNDPGAAISVFYRMFGM